MSTMEHLILALTSILTFITTEVSSIQCYQCFINPPPGHYYNTTKRLCTHFDHSERFVVDCPYSTMCMKQDFHLDIQNGGHYYNTTKCLCKHFDHSERFVVDCPSSTMCMKQNFHLDVQNGVRIDGVLRDCASQKHEYQAYIAGSWEPRVEVLEPYQEGCQNVDDKGERIANTRYCYCKSNLCNTSPSTNHEGYTDIMGVIVVFNLMKYINSLR